MKKFFDIRRVKIDEQTDVIKEYLKRLDAEHRFFMEEYFKRPNKELDEALNNLSEEAQFLLLLMLLDNIMRWQNEQKNQKEKDNTET